MRILIIAEARTGGTTLMDYFEKQFSEYKLITEPYTYPDKGWIDTDDFMNVDWYKENNDIIVKEIYNDKHDFTNLIKNSDKVLCVYRKNWYEQVRSILFAEYSEKFTKNYKIEDVNQVITDTMINEKYVNHYKKMKVSFKNFIKKNNFLNVTYEDLYYGDGIYIINNYLHIEHNISFPPVKRYLKDKNGNPYICETKNLKLI